MISGKRIFPVILFLFIFLMGLSSGEAVVDRVVAIVNQEIITLSEVERGIGPLYEQIQVQDRLERRGRVYEARRKVLEQLVEEKLLEQEAKKVGIKVSAKEIENAREEIKSRNRINQEELELALRREGLTLEVFQKQIEKKILRSKLVAMALKAQSNPKEEELRNFFQKNVDRYQEMESYRPGHILFQVPQKAGPDQVKEIRKKCERVLEKIKKGEDFGELALLYSEDISAKDRGDLGFFKKGELIPAIEREALRLKIGEVNGPVRTDHGFHIVKLLDRKGGAPPPFEEIRERIRGDYFENQMDKAYKKFITTLKEKSAIEIKL